MGEFLEVGSAMFPVLIWWPKYYHPLGLKCSCIYPDVYGSGKAGPVSGAGEVGEYCVGAGGLLIVIMSAVCQVHFLPPPHPGLMHMVVGQSCTRLLIVGSFVGIYIYVSPMLVTIRSTHALDNLLA